MTSRLESNMNLLVIHKAWQPFDGEFVRVRNVANEIIDALGCHKVVEVAVIPAFPPSRFFRARTGPHAVVGSRRLILPLVLPRLRIPFMRTVNRAIQIAIGWLAGRATKPGVVFGATSGAWVAAKAGAKGANTVSIVDIHGASAEEMEYAIPQSPWRDADIHIADLNERDILTHNGLVICQSEAMVDHLSAKHPLRPARLVAYGCGVDTNLFRFEAGDRVRVRTQLGVTDSESVLVYSGGLHRWQLVDNTLELFKRFLTLNPGRHKLLFLSRDEPETVFDQVRRHGLASESVVIRQLAHRDVPSYLSAADAGLLLRHDNVLNRVASPTKLGEYLACGLPVIVGPVAKYWSAIKNPSPQCALVVDPDNPERAASDLIKFLADLSGHRDHRRACCRELAASHLSISNFSATLKRALCDTRLTESTSHESSSRN